MTALWCATTTALLVVLATAQQDARPCQDELVDCTGVDCSDVFALQVVCRASCGDCPSQSPTHAPTSTPTDHPTDSPTVAPTSSSPTTSLPTAAPTTAPTSAPSAGPTTPEPTSAPTMGPTLTPSESPTVPHCFGEEDNELCARLANSGTACGVLSVRQSCPVICAEHGHPCTSTTSTQTTVTSTTATVAGNIQCGTTITASGYPTSLLAVPAAQCSTQARLLTAVLRSCGLPVEAAAIQCTASHLNPDPSIRFLDGGCLSGPSTASAFNAAITGFWSNPAAIISRAARTYPLNAGINAVGCVPFSNFLAVPSDTCTDVAAVINDVIESFVDGPFGTCSFSSSSTMTTWSITSSTTTTTSTTTTSTTTTSTTTTSTTTTSSTTTDSTTTGTTTSVTMTTTTGTTTTSTTSQTTTTETTVSSSTVTTSTTSSTTSSTTTTSTITSSTTTSTTLTTSSLSSTTTLTTVAPTETPTGMPTSSPTSVPTLEPTVLPTSAPTSHPSTVPTVTPTLAPTALPSMPPTLPPTASPTVLPTHLPTRIPTVLPTLAPTLHPTVMPTLIPTTVPTVSPTAMPTEFPSASPTNIPTVYPSALPTDIPTARPSPSPSVSPSASPTAFPSVRPSRSPSVLPTAFPTPNPTEQPSRSPTGAPTTSPSQIPTATPTVPTCNGQPDPPVCNYVTCFLASAQCPVKCFTCVSPSPTPRPSSSPTTAAPTTLFPTNSPTQSPTRAPSTAEPTQHPTQTPTAVPSSAPTAPTAEPTQTPSSSSPTTVAPTNAPSVPPPTGPPTLFPSFEPTVFSNLCNGQPDPPECIALPCSLASTTCRVKCSTCPRPPSRAPTVEPFIRVPQYPLVVHQRPSSRTTFAITILYSSPTNVSIIAVGSRHRLIRRIEVVGFESPSNLPASSTNTTVHITLADSVNPGNYSFTLWLTRGSWDSRFANTGSLPITIEDASMSDSLQITNAPRVLNGTLGQQKTLHIEAFYNNRGSAPMRLYPLVHGSRRGYIVSADVAINGSPAESVGIARLPGASSGTVMVDLRLGSWTTTSDNYEIQLVMTPGQYRDPRRVMSDTVPFAVMDQHIDISSVTSPIVNSGRALYTTIAFSYATMHPAVTLVPIVTNSAGQRGWVRESVVQSSTTSTGVIRGSHLVQGFLRVKLGSWIDAGTYGIEVVAVENPPELQRIVWNNRFARSSRLTFVVERIAGAEAGREFTRSEDKDTSSEASGRAFMADKGGHLALVATALLAVVVLSVAFWRYRTPMSGQVHLMERESESHLQRIASASV